MLFEICIIAAIFRFLHYSKSYIDTVLTVYFLNFLRKIIQLLIKGRPSI